MTSPQQAKGDRAERELIGVLADLGVKCRRTRLAGRDDHGDLSGIPQVAAQVKNYADVARGVREALSGAQEQKERAGAMWGVGFVRRPGGRWVVCMTVDDFVSMHREATIGAAGVRGEEQ